MTHKHEVVVVGRMTASHDSMKVVAENFLHIEPNTVLYEGIDLLVAKPHSVNLLQLEDVYRECVDHIKWAHESGSPSMVPVKTPASEQYFKHSLYQLWARRFYVEDYYVKFYLVTEEVAK